MSDLLPVVVGISGASGAILGRRLVDRLLAMGRPVAATASPVAREIWQQELGVPFREDVERWRSASSGFVLYGEREWARPSPPAPIPRRR